MTPGALSSGAACALFCQGKNGDLLEMTPISSGSLLQRGGSQTIQHELCLAAQMRDWRTSNRDLVNAIGALVPHVWKLEMRAAVEPPAEYPF
jgi:hypothetical protein